MSVVAMTGDATGKTHVGERLLVRTGAEQLGLKDVTVRADIGDVGDAGRHRSVIAMTGGAGGCAQVATDHHGVVMDALLIIGELIGLDAVRLHVIGISVTTRASGGDVGGMDLGARIGRSAQVVDAMAIGANRDLAVALGPLGAVNAGLVLLELIDAQAGIVLFHPLGIGVAGSAEFGNLLAIDLALPSWLARLIAFSGSSLVASPPWHARTVSPFWRVDVLAVSLHGDAERLRQIGVAIETRILRLRGCRTPTHSNCSHPRQCMHTDRENLHAMQPHFATQPYTVIAAMYPRKTQANPVIQRPRVERLFAIEERQQQGDGADTRTPGCPASRRPCPRIFAGISFSVWNMNRKYHSGLMPAGAEANGSAFTPRPHGNKAASAPSNPSATYHAINFAQHEVGEEADLASFPAEEIPTLLSPRAARSCRTIESMRRA